ncbi:MAG: hypothetical protein ABIN37_11760 [Burkholderiaceae bacterium]
MTPALHICIASKLDAEAIAAMSRDLIEHGLPWSWRSERVTRAIEAANINVVVLRDQSEPSLKRSAWERSMRAVIL